jgi:hypothetical protein
MENKSFVRSHDGFKYMMSIGRITVDILEKLFLLKNPLCVHQESMDVVRPTADGKFNTAQGETYVVLPQDVVDSDEPEPPEFRPGAFTMEERAGKIGNAVQNVIKEYYQPLHPEIYFFDENFLAASFREAFAGNLAEDLPKIMKQETTDTKVFTFEIFTKEFCAKFVEEIEHFESTGLPISRPNSMNNYGLILADLGFTDFIDQLLLKYMAKFARFFYPEWREAQNLDSHHSFIVQYKTNEDLDLGFHYDDSHVTLNVCLGKEFTGGELYFRGLYHFSETHNEHFKLAHAPGRGVVHLGQHRHGAHKITSGARYNLIIWGRCNEIYQATHQKQQHHGNDDHDNN